MLPSPIGENRRCHLIDILLFNLSLEKTYKSYAFVMQEDLYIFLFIRPVKAPNVPARNTIHGGLVEPALLAEPRPKSGKGCDEQWVILSLMSKYDGPKFPPLGCMLK